MKSAVSEPSDKPKTDALKNFEANLELLISFLDRFNPTDLERKAKAMLRAIERFKVDPKTVASLTRAGDKVNAAITEHLAASQIAHEWIGVMLVTFTEAYIEDGLVSVAGINSKLMK